MSWLFGSEPPPPPPPKPEELCRTWRRNIGREKKAVERRIRTLEAEEAKVKRQIKGYIDKRQPELARILARELVSSRAAKKQMWESVAHLNSVDMTLQQNMATYRVAQQMQVSTVIMTAMNKLVSVPALQETAVTMAREMEKAGLVSEIIETTLNEPGVEDEADAEVDAILEEVTQQRLPAAASTALPKTAAPAAAAAAAAAKPAAADVDAQMAAMLADAAVKHAEEERAKELAE